MDAGRARLIALIYRGDEIKTDVWSAGGGGQRRPACAAEWMASPPRAGARTHIDEPVGDVVALGVRVSDAYLDAVDVQHVLLAVGGGQDRPADEQQQRRGGSSRGPHCWAAAANAKAELLLLLLLWDAEQARARAERCATAVYTQVSYAMRYVSSWAEGAVRSSTQGCLGRAGGPAQGCQRPACSQRVGDWQKILIIHVDGFGEDNHFDDYY